MQIHNLSAEIADETVGSLILQSRAQSERMTPCSIRWNVCNDAKLFDTIFEPWLDGRYRYLADRPLGLSGVCSFSKEQPVGRPFPE